MKKKLKRILILLFLFVAVSATLITGKSKLDESKNIEIKKVRIFGNNIVSDEVIKSCINIKIMKDIKDTDLENFSKKLLTIKYIDEVLIGVDLPSTLSIKIRERSPIAWVLQEGKLVPVNQYGICLPEPPDNIVLDMPVVTGVKLKKTKPGIAFKNHGLHKALAILNICKKCDVNLYGDFSEINMDSENNYKLITAKLGIPVLIGKDNFIRKLCIYKNFQSYCRQTSTAMSFKYINLNYKDQIVVKDKNIKQ